MKILIVACILIYSFIPKSFAHAGDEEVRKAEAFQACVVDCTTYEEPGYALKSCIESCKDKYLDQQGDEPLSCDSKQDTCGNSF